VPAKASFTRPFVRDKKLLQREATGGTTWLALPAYALLGVIAAIWLVAMGLGLRRLETAADGLPGEPLERLPRRFRRTSGRVVTPA
jgi:hypothetical protein